MTATPIPRSLALTLYGDMECSYIRQRPSQRAQTTTKVLPRRQRGEAYDAIREAVDAGHQAYIICPIIDAPEEEEQEEEDEVQLLTEFADPSLFEDVHAAQREYEILSSQVFPTYQVALLTGRMSNQDKRRVMEEFRSGAVQILVSTTVVEVGVDVPNATVMLVENAERFGLTQLHQLRGRVGRGSDPAQVFLIAQPTTEEGRARMEAMERTDDGFELAEYDLTLRREGDILGVRQHGTSQLKLVNVMSDEKLIACAHADAVALLEQDPYLSKPEHALLAHDLDMVFGEEQTDG